MHMCRSLIFIILNINHVISQHETDWSNKVGVLVCVRVDFKSNFET